MSFLDFCFSSNWERERERGIYKIWVYRRNSPKVTYLFFRRGSTGEFFFFHGLIGFKLFLTLAWRTWVPRVSDILLSSTRSKWLWVCLPRALSNNCLSYFLYSLTGRGPYFRFRVPAHHLASPSSPLVSGDLRLLSTDTCWYPLCDLHSFLTVTFLTGCHCSFQREDSINLISIVSVGYHLTLINNRRRLTCYQSKEKTKQTIINNYKSMRIIYKPIY